MSECWTCASHCHKTSECPHRLRRRPQEHRAPSPLPLSPPPPRPPRVDQREPVPPHPGVIPNEPPNIPTPLRPRSQQQQRLRQSPQHDERHRDVQPPITTEAGQQPEHSRQQQDADVAAVMLPCAPPSPPPPSPPGGTLSSSSPPATTAAATRARSPPPERADPLEWKVIGGLLELPISRLSSSASPSPPPRPPPPSPLRHRKDSGDVYSAGSSPDGGVRRRILAVGGALRSNRGLGRLKAVAVRAVRCGVPSTEEDARADGMLGGRGVWDNALFGRREPGRRRPGRQRGQEKRQGQGRSEKLRRMKLSGAVLASQAAQNALEDLASATPVWQGGILLVCAVAVGANRSVVCASLWSVLLGTGAVLWRRAYLPPASCSSSRVETASLGWRGGNLCPLFWVEEAVVDRGDRGGGGDGGVVSAANTRMLAMAVACAPSALDVLSQFFFVRLAARSDGGWYLVGALWVASMVYAGSVGFAVTARGRGELRGGFKFRYLTVSWHALLILGAVVLAGQWGYDLISQTVGSVLLTLAAWKLATVSARVVEQSIRHGLVVTLGGVLKSAGDPDELSPESILELAAGQWLVEYWSQPTSFRPPELRARLVRAIPSLFKEETVRDGGGGRIWRAGLRRTTGPTAVADLTEWLERPGRAIHPPAVTRLEAALESLVPDRKALKAFLYLRACPTLCSVPLLLVTTVVSSPVLTRDVAFLLALMGPVGVELWRLQGMRHEVDGDHGSGGKSLVDLVEAEGKVDNLTILLRMSNPALGRVWANARRAVECLRTDSTSSVCLDSPADRARKVFHRGEFSAVNGANTLRELATGGNGEGTAFAANRPARESPVNSRPMLVETPLCGSPAAPGTETDNRFVGGPPRRVRDSPAVSSVSYPAGSRVPGGVAMHVDVHAVDMGDRGNERSEEDGMGVSRSTVAAARPRPHPTVSSPPRLRLPSGEDGETRACSEAAAAEIEASNAVAHLDSNASGATGSLIPPAPDTAAVVAPACRDEVHSARQQEGGLISGAGEAVFGTVAGVAGELAGAFGGAAGEAIRSVADWSGVFGWWDGWQGDGGGGPSADRGLADNNACRVGSTIVVLNGVTGKSGAGQGHPDRIAGAGGGNQSTTEGGGHCHDAVGVAGAGAGGEHSRLSDEGGDSEACDVVAAVRRGDERVAHSGHVVDAPSVDSSGGSCSGSSSSSSKIPDDGRGSNAGEEKNEGVGIGVGAAYGDSRLEEERGNYNDFCAGRPQRALDNRQCSWPSCDSANGARTMHAEMGRGAGPRGGKQLANHATRTQNGTSTLPDERLQATTPNVVAVSQKALRRRRTAATSAFNGVVDAADIPALQNGWHLTFDNSSPEGDVGLRDDAGAAPVDGQAAKRVATAVGVQEGQQAAGTGSASAGVQQLTNNRSGDADVEAQQGGGVLSCLAAWTLSSATAVAGGAAMALLSGFSNAGGEHAAGKDGRDRAATRVSIGGGQAVKSEGGAETGAVHGER